MGTRYDSRTVEWGHWGITFMDVQPDRTKNFGTIIGTLSFGVGNAGPVDGPVGSPTRLAYLQACKDWTERGILPERLAYSSQVAA